MTVSRQSALSEWVMGEVAPAGKLQLFGRVSAVVLTLDVLSKALAFACLDEGAEHWVGDTLSLHLTYNEAGIGQKLRGQIRELGAPTMLLTTVGLLLGLLVPLVYSRATHPPLWKAASLLGVPSATAMVASFSGLAVTVVMPHAYVPDDAIRLAQVVAAFAFWWLCLRLTRNKYLFMAASIQVGAGVGNVANSLVHPRGVIDFLWVPAFSPRLGIFNLADIAIEMSFGLFLSFPLVAAFAFAPGFATTWNKLVWPVEESVLSPTTPRRPGSPLER